MTDRPAWMNPDHPKNKSQVSGAKRQAQSYIKSEISPAPSQQVVQMRMPSVVTAGIAIIATLMLMSFYFWIVVWLFGRINPPAGEEFGLVFMSDYLTTLRVVLATVVSAFLTAVTWSLGTQFASE